MVVYQNQSRLTLVYRTIARFLIGDGGAMSVCSNIAIGVVFLVYFTDQHWTAVDPVSFLFFITVIMASRFATDASSKAETVCYLTFLALVCTAAYLTNLIVDHECTQCVAMFPDLVQTYVVPKPGQERLDAWQLFTDEKKTPQLCAACVIYISTGIRFVKWAPEWLERRFEEHVFDTLDDFAEIHKLKPAVQDALEAHAETNQDANGNNKNSSPIVEDSSALSPTEIRDLDEWYLEMRKSGAPKGAFNKFIHALAADVNSQQGNDLLASMAHDFLCYPTSRVNGPKPSEFLQRLKVPCFTGEEESKGDGPMQLEFEKLTAIMRGDKMRELPPDVCAMIRLASMIASDDSVLTSGMSAAMVAPIANEQTLKGHDVGLLFPGLFVPKVDEDKDPEGSFSRVTETLIALFVRLPVVDDDVWFESSEEYIALFRWLLEHKLQDEYYFPKWLSRINGTEDVTELMDEMGHLVADQFLYRGDRQRIFEPTSDATLADRAFYGAGVKTLSRIVLPGDASFGFLMDPANYATLAEREFFRNKAMPTEEDLLRMVSVAWGQDVESLELLRDKVVQVDYTIASHWEYREAYEQNGAILYLDAETRTPIGIWVSCQEQLVLPNAGQNWEHAKFIHRSTEVVVAAVLHVGEYHLGWANRFNTAIRQTLPPSHGLRTLMKPYTHGTGIVNWNAYQMLVLDDSILARANGLTNRARGFSWGHLLKHSDIVSTFPQALEAKSLQGVSNLTTTLPYFTQGVKLWDIHREYVENFVNLVYGDDDSRFLKDDALRRFWHHANTAGRHLDPCVCNMDSASYFKQDEWPAFESTRTCAGLLDHANFKTSDSDAKHRRELWCNQSLPIERSKYLYHWLETDCENSNVCTQVSFEAAHLRPDMGLPELTREALVNLITRFIYEVTAGHELVADNLPFIIDPAYGGVRRLKGYDDAATPTTDVSTWIFGTVISTLTTIRSMPLLSDWSGLLISWVDNKDDWRRLSDADRAERKELLTKMHFDYKSKLIFNANHFLKETLKRPENQWSPFLNPSVQAASIAV